MTYFRASVIIFGSFVCCLNHVFAQTTDNDFEAQIWNPVRSYALVKLTVHCKPSSGVAANASESGTGFVVGGRYIFTARHILLGCIRGSYNADDPNAVVGADLRKAAEDATQDVSITFSDRSDHEQVTSLTTATISDNADFGYLDVPATSGSRPSLCLAPSLRFVLANHVTFYGFGLNTAPRSRSGDIEVAEDTNHMALLRVTAGPGWSGSPVVDKNGYVRGLVIEGSGDTEVVLPLSYVRPKFENLNVMAPENFKEPDLDLNEKFSSCSAHNSSQRARSGPVTIPAVSGWVGGGWDPQRFCSSEVERLRSSYKNGNFSMSDLGEESNKDWLGQVHYKYHCTINVSTEDNLNIAESDSRQPSCGPRNLDADPLVCPLR